MSEKQKRYLCVLGQLIYFLNQHVKQAERIKFVLLEECFDGVIVKQANYKEISGYVPRNTSIFKEGFEDKQCVNWS